MVASLLLGVLLCILIPIVIWHSSALLRLQPIGQVSQIRNPSAQTPYHGRSKDTAPPLSPLTNREEAFTTTTLHAEECLDVPDDVVTGRVRARSSTIAGVVVATSTDRKTQTPSTCHRCTQRCAPNKVRGSCRRCRAVNRPPSNPISAYTRIDTV